MSASGCGSECVGGVSPAAPAWGAALMRLRVGGAAPWRRRSGRSGRLCTDSPGTCSSSWPQSEQYSQPMTTREVPPAAPSPRTGDWDSPGTWWEGAGGGACAVAACSPSRARAHGASAPPTAVGGAGPPARTCRARSKEGDSQLFWARIGSRPAGRTGWGAAYRKHPRGALGADDIAPSCLLVAAFPVLPGKVNTHKRIQRDTHQVLEVPAAESGNLCRGRARRQAVCP